VITGYARAEKGKTNAWGPDPKKPLPQWIELAWDKPQTFNMAHVTFLTKRHAPERFALQAACNGGWRTLAEVTGNRHRRHVLGVARTTTSGLRLALLAAGQAQLGVCEIRVYDEPERLLEIAARAARKRDLPDPPPALGWDDRTPWFTGLDPRKLGGIVLDDTQGERTGDWVVSDYSKPFIGEGYCHDGNAGKGQKSLRFGLNVPRPGKYELRLAYSALDNRAARVPVKITTAAGTTTTSVNQREQPPIDGLWRSLGMFHLSPDDAAEVVVGNADADGYVTVDAIQMVPVER
jgi:hypothetical protein